MTIYAQKTGSGSSPQAQLSREISRKRALEEFNRAYDIGQTVALGRDPKGGNRTGVITGPARLVTAVCVQIAGVGLVPIDQVHPAGQPGGSLEEDLEEAFA